MNLAILSLTEQGRLLSQKAAAHLKSAHTVTRYCFAAHTDRDAASFSDLADLVRRLFPRQDGLVFCCACGIAVRAIAPWVRSKTTDPAVVVMDDGGQFAISLLSGHLGGANRLTEILAEKLGALPVITTATDVAKRFSPDSFAKANGLLLSDLAAAKAVAAAVLDGEPVGLRSDYPCQNIPPELVPNGQTRVGVAITAGDGARPFPVTLRLTPRNLVLGIGCKKGTPPAAIQTQAAACLAKAGLAPERVCAVATVDKKKEEPGLAAFCASQKLPLDAYPAAELMQVPGTFTASSFVLAQTGTDNVCERSAVRRSGGPLLCRKTAGHGVTVAVAEIPVILDFHRRTL